MTTSIYSISAGDLTPDLIPAGEYADLIREGLSGGAALDLGELITACEAEFHSHLGGVPTTADVQALCRPQVLNIIVYRLYARKYQGPEASINPATLAGYQAAIKWAGGMGQRLLAAEGASVAGTGNVEHSAPIQRWGMDQLEGL